MKQKTSVLAELMGDYGATMGNQLRLEHLPKLLGGGMPELPLNAVGRHRLLMALKQRFGANFRSLPGVRNLLTEFDGQISHAQRVEQLRQIKPEGN